MDELEAAVRKVLADMPELRELPAKKFNRFLERVAREAGKASAKDLLARAPDMLEERRKAQAGFERRNLKRWRKAFDLMETIWACCEELGREFNAHFRPEAAAGLDYTFEAMVSVHANALLVTSEMICLMKGGYADGALTRWRTLYELSVVANLLADGGDDLALRYLAHADVQAAAEYEPEDLETDEKAREIKRRADNAVMQLGEDLKSRYGWAAGLTGKRKPTFRDLERLTGQDGEALYRHASRHVHSNHRRYDHLLAGGEVESPVLLVASSNGGMVGPLTLGAISMTEITVRLLAIRPNLDRAAFMTALMSMSGRMQKLAERIEARTLAAARRRINSATAD